MGFDTLTEEQKAKLLACETPEEALDLIKAEAALKANESQFIAVFGRRRVGKTYLVREALAGSFAFQHTGYANTGTKGQLFAFAASLKEYGLRDFDNPCAV